MISALLGVVVLVGVATLAVAVGAWRSSRRSEGLGENRYELLRDQQERLELLRPWGIAGVITSHERAVEPLSRRGFRVERRSEGSLLLTRP